MSGCLRRLAHGLVWFAICTIALCAGCERRDPAAAEAAAREPPSHHAPAREEFERVYADWIRVLTRLRDLELAVHSAPARHRPQLARQFYEQLPEGYELEQELLSAAVRAFAADPRQNADLKELLTQIQSILVRAECYEDALNVSTQLLDSNVDEVAVCQNAADAAFACAEFDLAERCMRRLGTGKGANPENLQRLALIDAYKKEWAREEKLREAEQAAGDQPRVLLVTTQGEIELELFEDAAPNTVANFIALVEDRFYDGMPFFEVTAKFAACTGCPLGNGKGSPGHLIRNECDRPERRVHFRGSLSTISEGQLANGSQFCITFQPIPYLEQQSTVFGRVVRGIEVLARLQRRGTDTMSSLVTPDTLIAARVLRKRSHKYEPKRIPDPTAEQRRRDAEFTQRLFAR